MKQWNNLNPIIHAPVRLMVMTLLVQVIETDFSYLKQTTGTTDGNLSTHLTKLENAGFIKVTKRFVRKKPKTTVLITDTGRDAYSRYIKMLQSYLSAGYLEKCIE